MSFSSFGKIIYDKYQKVASFRTFISTPVLIILKFFKITPNLVSYFGVLLMLGFLVSIFFKNINLAIVLFVLSRIADSLDGSLARYLKIDSDKGKFVDSICDSISFTILMVGFLLLDLVDGIAALLYIYFMSLGRILAIVKHNFYEQSDWFIHLWAGIIPLVFAFFTYVLFFVWFFFEINWINISSYIFAGLMFVKVMVDYWDIKDKVVSHKNFLKNKFKKKRIKYLRKKKEKLDKKIKKLSNK